MKDLPYRLVHHQLPDTAGHLDIFLLIYGQDSLCTYELAEGFADGFIEKTQGSPQGSDLRLIALFRSKTAMKQYSAKYSKDSPADRLWPATRKQDHRLCYWDYSGPISGNRGAIREIGRGIFFCNPEDLFPCSRVISPASCLYALISQKPGERFFNNF